MTENKRLGIEEIYQTIPHRRPFMFLESAEVVDLGRLATGQLTDLSHQDFSFLKAHFPNDFIVPGAILMEALAELSGIAAIWGLETEDKLIGVLVADKMRYRQMVRPGEEVQLEAEIIGKRKIFWRSKVKAFKDGKLAVEGEITFALINQLS